MNGLRAQKRQLKAVKNAFKARYLNGCLCHYEEVACICVKMPSYTARRFHYAHVHVSVVIGRFDDKPLI